MAPLLEFVFAPALGQAQAWSPLGDGTYGVVTAIAIDGNNVYVGGKLTYAGKVRANYVAKWDNTIKSWSSLGSGSGVNNLVLALEIDSDESLYVGGAFKTSGAISEHKVAKWKNNN